jgi:asparagine N-glycosylation enzyme membrane subunit Stt3
MTWPDVPSSFRVPRPVAIVLAVALGLSFAGGPVGMAGVIVSGVLLMAFVFQGLAVVHGVTRGKSYRLPLLIIVYLTLIWTVAFYGLLGLLDAGFAFRDRQKPIVRKKT